MADPTLLDVVAQRFGTVLDRDSDGGRILGALRPTPALSGQATSGRAAVAPLAFALTPSGVSVRAAEGTDAVVLALPSGPLDFRLVAPAGGAPGRVELTLTALSAPLPFLRPGRANADGTLQALGGEVRLELPKVLLVVTATAPAATARLAPATGAGDAFEARMTPPLALVGPGAVVGLGFDRAALTLEGPGAPRLTVSPAVVHVSPPGIPALALRGAADGLVLELGPGGGLSGDVSLGQAPAPAQRPRFVSDLAARLRLVRNAVTLLEITGRIDLGGEVARRTGPLGDETGPLRFRLGLRLDDGWRADLRLEGSGDGALWRTVSSGGDDPVRDTLGAFAVFAPLLAGAAPAAGPSGFAAIGVAAGMSAAVAGSRWLTTRSLSLLGAELVVRTPAAGAPQAFLFFDVEVELQLSADAEGLELLRTRVPLKVRQRAIGLRLDFGPDGGAPRLEPVFDPVRGFGLDLRDPGVLTVPGPLGDLLQPEGVRMARSNPLALEVDLVLKADLGVVSVDRSSVRVPLDGGGGPTLTALGARVDVPGLLNGGGYLRLQPGGGIAGRMDAALTPPLGVRVAAGAAVDRVHDDGTALSAVLVTLGVELPVGIPLASSGLGLFGFHGLFGMHYRRREDAGETALDWFVGPAQGDATRIEAWEPAAHTWALGLGTVIGTMEGGFVLNAKGMVVLEVPGPRVLLAMKLSMLAARPPTKGQPSTGALLAVIDVRRESLTIGVVAEYALKPLLELRAPVEAFFDFEDAERWHLDVGGIPPKLPVSVKVLTSFRADGYLLVHGDGIPDFPPRPLHGLAIAAGLRAALTWGPEPIGLYLRVAAQADLGISFKPLLVVGTLTLSGELHLFVVSVEASASAEVIVSPDAFFVSARVCGSVDFFFFEVSGCVRLELGRRPSELPPPEPLVRALSLHSRSPALARGSGADRAVDGSLGDAARLVDGQWQGTPPTVPIDAIPVLQLELRPAVDPACTFRGRPIPPKLPPNGWVRRGERFYRYTLRSVALDGAIDAGETPVVWWDRQPQAVAGDDTEVQLALLSWVPDPTPVAAERTVSLDERVKRRWGDLCRPVAPPARVLWSFERAHLGPSPPGWTRQGVPWPDEPGTLRLSPPATTLTVTEPWRRDDQLLDALLRVTPAHLVGAAESPSRLLVAPRVDLSPRPLVATDAFEELVTALAPPAPAYAPPGGPCFADSLRLRADGFASLRLLLFVDRRVWEEQALVVRPLDARFDAVGGDEAVAPPAARPVADVDDLPPEWRDPGGPWRATVEGVLDLWIRYLREAGDEGLLVTIALDLPPDTVHVDVGLDRRLEDDDTRWGLLLADGLTAAEVRRFAYDKDQRSHEIAVVDGALGADQGERALLRPNTTYEVTVDYDVLVTGADEHGNPQETGLGRPQAVEQRFRFTTDAQAPARLDPWVLATAPSAGEQCVFHADPLRLVLATNATRKLLAAYGRTPFAVVRAASGRHPPGGGAFDAHEVALADALVPPQPLPAVALSPFAAALGEVVREQDCVAASGGMNLHERVTLTLRLEPSTDYVLDVELRPGATPTYPPLRRHFSTSRYATMAALAAAVAAAPVRHRRAADVTALATLPAPALGTQAVAVDDLALERVLRALRWGDLAAPRDPCVTVLWRDAASAAQRAAIAAVLIEAPEPLWRWRDVPREVADQDGTRRFELRPAAWLEVAAGTPAAVSALVRSTGGTRTLVRVSPLAGATPPTLTLWLRRLPLPLFEAGGSIEQQPLATIDLAARAPWEVEP